MINLGDLSKASAKTPEILQNLDTVLGPAHITTEEFENRALFLRLGLPSTLIWRNCPTKTELFENALENRGI